MAKKNANGKWKKNRENIQLGLAQIEKHSLFAHLLKRIAIVNFRYDVLQPKDCWAQIHDKIDKNRDYSSQWGLPIAEIRLNYQKNLSAEEWLYIISLALLHIGLNHIRPEQNTPQWHIACELFVRSFISNLKPGHIPRDFPVIDTLGLPLRSEESLYQYFSKQEQRLDKYKNCGIGGSLPSWVISGGAEKLPEPVEKFRTQAFVKGLRKTVKNVIEEASSQQYNGKLSAEIKAAQSWVINSFPLLSALASSFKLIEDEAICHTLQIEIAAVQPELREVYINPRWSFSENELRFILAHEFLHVGLRHEIRLQGRDPYFWNIACDYVINGWLMEMGVGILPSNGLLYDEKLKERSAEDIYDEIVKSLRWQRRLKKTQTPRGYGKPDVITERLPTWWTRGEGVDLDAFYRRSLQEGQKWYADRDRGYLPAGLIEEIKALNQPPIPWDVKLVQWLDQFFPPLEKRRSYARMSRRQSATPNIPRPYWMSPDEHRETRTFAVVLDTSGSMTRTELAKAIGAIASYALSRDVTAVRIVYCDAQPYDAGYIVSEALLHQIEIRGRGGTVLQPAINLLQQAEDFPDNGPVLIITDGVIDRLEIRQPHAYLMSQGQRLPFNTNAPIFYYQ